MVYLFFLDVFDVVGLKDCGDNLIIVDNADFSTFNLKSGTGITADTNPIAFFAPLAIFVVGITEFGLVLVSQGTHF